MHDGARLLLDDCNCRSESESQSSLPAIFFILCPSIKLSSLPTSIPKEPTVTNPTISGKLGKRNRNPIHIPHRTIPLPKGQDLDLRRADVALAFYREMRHCRISPNVYTPNMVMAAYCKLGKLEDAVEVLEEMESMDCSPSVVSYNTLIAGHRDKGLLSSSLKFKNLMAKNGLHPTVVTFNTLIDGFCKAGKLQEENRVFSESKPRMWLLTR
ncbi:hypothetical protein ACFX12_045907 [Malus domestica]